MQRVLLIGNDEVLLKTRAAVLEVTGSHVVLSFPHTLRDLTPADPFDLAVLCHTVPDTTRVPLSTTVRSLWPQIKVLQVHGLAFRSPAPHADDVSDPMPQELIACSNRLLAR